MTFDFTDKISGDLHHLKPILISGAGSLQFSGREYLVIDNGEKKLFEIRYEYHCSPFKQIFISHNILAVGFEENFYLFDLVTNRDILSLKMDGYFGHLYLHEDNFYVADAGGLHCINIAGTTLWRNKNLAMDGVIIHDFLENKILGSGEWDPPGGWRDFTLDKKTGTLIE